MWSWRSWRSESRERRRSDERTRRDRRHRVAQEQVALNERCAALVGEVLQRVVHVELDYGDEPMWNHCPDPQTIRLDFGAERVLMTEPHSSPATA